MRLLSVTLFMGSAVWACAMFVYQWTHDDLTTMEVLKATPEALVEMSNALLFSTLIGAAFAWRVIEYESRKRREPAAPERTPTLHVLHGSPSLDARGDHMFTPKDGGKSGRIIGWRCGLHNGDLLMLWNDAARRASRYRIVRLEYKRDPDDMFFADVVHDPMKEGDYMPGDCPACGTLDCRAVAGEGRAYCCNCGRITPV